MWSGREIRAVNSERSRRQIRCLLERKNYTMWIQKIIVLIYGLALTIGFVTHRHIDTCYIELYQQSNLLGDKVKVQYKRSNIRKINAKSIEVTGDPAYCCFKVFR